MITWNIKNTKRQVASGLVTMVTMQLVAQQDDAVVEQEMDIVLRPKDSADPGFVPFEQLTKDQVTQWVHQSLTPEGVASAEAEISAKLQEKLSPPVMDGLPWKE